MKVKVVNENLALTITPWQFKLLVLAMRKYLPDSTEASEFPEEAWTFMKKLNDELRFVDFMEEIQKPDDKGTIGPMPKIE